MIAKKYVKNTIADVEEVLVEDVEELLFLFPHSK